MKISDEIFRIVAETKPVATAVTGTSNLYIDLGFDSLAFVYLLLEIEKAFSIKFELLEMSQCVKIDRLISIVEQKVKELAND